MSDQEAPYGSLCATSSCWGLGLLQGVPYPELFEDENEGAPGLDGGEAGREDTGQVLSLAAVRLGGSWSRVSASGQRSCAREDRVDLPHDFPEGSWTLSGGDQMPYKSPKH